MRDEQTGESYLRVRMALAGVMDRAIETLRAVLDGLRR